MTGAAFAGVAFAGVELDAVDFFSGASALALSVAEVLAAAFLTGRGLTVPRGVRVRVGLGREASPTAVLPVLTGVFLAGVVVAFLVVDVAAGA